MRTARPRGGGFTLVELLVVIGIIALLIGMLMPTLSRVRVSADRTRCLSNLRQLAIAQSAYAAAHRNALVVAGDGQEQGAWMELLRPYTGTADLRRCPSDQSVHFVEPTAAGRLRHTSYGVSNLVSVTHAPSAYANVRMVTHVRSASRTIQFAELAERGTPAVSDHVHVQDFYSALLPQLTLSRIGQQIPLGRHGGRPAQWNAVLNYSFLDGHAEALPIREVYTDPKVNLFDPLIKR